MDLHRLLPEVARIAEQAGRAIMDVYAGAFEVVQKADASPVTAADLAAERLIHDALLALTPSLPILTEERPAPDLGGAGAYWCVDPLDGTRSFVARDDQFAVCIGLVQHGVPVLGVVHGPAHGVTYAGAVGIGAWRGRERIRTRPFARPLVVMASKDHLDPATMAYVEMLPEHALERCGSALKFGRVAEGSADLYPRFGAFNEWDAAAGHALVLAAGGRVLGWRGDPIPYGAPPYRVNGLVASGV